MDAAPIGIFDSGVGGLTVARSIMDKLPHEGIIYFGDSAHAPYGERSIDEVHDLALKGLDQLVTRGVKALVIACNTATAAALADARERYWVNKHIPVIEVITPAARTAAHVTRQGRIGVIGTRATIQSKEYEKALAHFPNLEVMTAACPRFVEFVEAGMTTGPELEEIARQYLSPLIEADIDTLVLGCTHYPLLTGVITRVMGPGVSLVTSSEETANDTYNFLVDSHALRPPVGAVSDVRHQFLTTGSAGVFVHLAQRFLGPEVEMASHISHDGVQDGS